MSTTPPKTYQELLAHAGTFVQEVLPEADGFAQGVVAAEIAGNIWPAIEAWRSVKTRTGRVSGRGKSNMTERER